MDTYREMFANFTIGQRVRITPPAEDMKNTREVGATVTSLGIKFRGIPTHEKILATFYFDRFPFTDKQWTPWGCDEVRLAHDTHWKIIRDAG